MIQAEYRAQLRRILDTVSDEVTAKFIRFHEAATAVSNSLVVDIFLDQDGDGPFNIWARFDGPGAFTLDRHFDDERQLFGVVWGENGWTPPVPARPDGWTRDELEEAVFDVVHEWLDPLIPNDTHNWELSSVEGVLDTRPLGMGRESLP
ncbi:DUF6389 family protein [Populibacterium corticicola]|uniref:DUF6389 family protein n=1 Tax=Populibacterium corticicola TaxID=1812826 RepID=A0ABW5XH34_9MICO